MKFLCIRCDSGVHTNSENASSACGCGLRTCGCYGLRVEQEVQKEKR
jgi:hypothetical protein